MKMGRDILHLIVGRPRTKSEMDQAVSGVDLYLDIHENDLTTSLIIGGLMTLALWTVTDGIGPFIWAAAVIGVEAVFSVVRLRISRARTTPANVYRRITTLQALSFATLLVWGPGILFAWDPDRLESQVLILLAWAGMFVVVVNQNFMIPRIAITSGSLPAALIMLVPLATAERPNEYALAGLSIVFVLTVLRIATHNLRLSTDLFQVQADKDELIGELETSRRAAEADRHRAEQASRAKSDFLAVMSHEIRTPMNGVLGMAHMLARSELNDEQRTYAETIVKSGDALLALLNDALDLSRIEAGRMSLDLDEENPRQIVSNLADLWSPRAADAGLAFNVEVASDVPARVEADGRKISQVLSNLVGNAVKFTEAGSITVRLFRREGQIGDGLVFEVIDTGPGISREAQRHIFEKFTQADASTTRRYGGSGLGLTISRELMALMGGDLDVDSAEGEGSTFRLSVPVRFLSGAPAAEPVHAPEPDEPRDIGRPLRVLVAEDHVINQKLMTAIVSNLGYEGEYVENGRQAVTAVEHGSFDVVLMDVQMPVMDGIEATRAIRALPGPRAATPIIALTANALSGDKEKYLAAGFDAYVSKPIDTRELAAAIQRVLPESTSKNEGGEANRASAAFGS